MTPTRLSHSRLIVVGLAAASFALVVSLFVSRDARPATVQHPNSSVLHLDWRSGTNGAFTTLECPHPDTQFKIVNNPSRQGGHAARFTIHSDDRWSNGEVRCLDANYNTGETVGDTYFFGFSMYVPRPGLSDNLIWELHQPSSLYTVNACGLAPFAVFVKGSAMQFRISTGDCVPGRGNAVHQLNIPIPTLKRYPRRRWIDFVIRISFSETNGSVDLWTRKVGEPWPTAPLITRRHIPTMPYCSSCGVHNVRLYTEMGLYPGSSNYSGTDTVYLDAYTRGPTFASVAP